MLVNTESLQALHTMLSAAFNAGLARTVDAGYAAISTIVPSNNKSNSYAWLKQIGSLREWVGDRVIEQMSGDTYTIVNKKWERTIAVDKEDIEDDQYGVYSPLAEDLGMAAMSHRAELVYELLADGEAQNGYDKVPFFSTAHPSEDGLPAQSNLIAGAEPAWYLADTTRPLLPMIFQLRDDVELTALLDPTDPNVFFKDQFLWGVRARYNAGFGFWQTILKSKKVLNETNLAEARAAMRSLKNSKGKPLAVVPTTLVVGPSLETQAEKLLTNLTLATGETNVTRGKYRLIVSPYLP